jgi:hypothetical protein
MNKIRLAQAVVFNVVNVMDHPSLNALNVPHHFHFIKIHAPQTVMMVTIQTLHNYVNFVIEFAEAALEPI